MFLSSLFFLQDHGKEQEERKNLLKRDMTRSFSFSQTNFFFCFSSSTPLMFTPAAMLGTYAHINALVRVASNMFDITYTYTLHTHTYTHTYKGPPRPTCLSLGRVPLYLLKPFIFMGNACFCEILFSYISWQGGEARAPLSYSKEKTHGRDHA